MAEGAGRGYCRVLDGCWVQGVLQCDGCCKGCYRVKAGFGVLRGLTLQPGAQHQAADQAEPQESRESHPDLR